MWAEIVATGGAGGTTTEWRSARIRSIEFKVVSTRGFIVHLLFHELSVLNGYRRNRESEF